MIQAMMHAAALVLRSETVKSFSRGCCRVYDPSNTDRPVTDVALCSTTSWTACGSPRIPRSLSQCKYTYRYRDAAVGVSTASASIAHALRRDEFAVSDTEPSWRWVSACRTRKEVEPTEADQWERDQDAMIVADDWYREREASEQSEQTEE